MRDLITAIALLGFSYGWMAFLHWFAYQVNQEGGGKFIRWARELLSPRWCQELWLPVFVIELLAAAIMFAYGVDTLELLLLAAIPAAGAVHSYRQLGGGVGYHP